MRKSPSALSGAETVRGAGLLRGAGVLQGATATQVIASLAAITMVGVAGVAGTSAALTDTTPVIDSATGDEVSRGVIPERAIVVQGTRMKEFPGGTFGLP